MLRKLIISFATLCVFAAGPATAQEKFRIAVAQGGFWDVAVPKMGQRSGIFKEEGLDVDVLYTAGTAENQQAVLSGSVDVGVAVGLLGIFAAYSKNAPIRVIAAQWTGASDFLWYVKADSPIQKLEDVSGKSVAFSTIGSSGHFVILTLLDQNKIKGAKLVATGGIPGTMTQVMSGQIDVGWSLVPVGLQEAQEGKLRIIARGSQALALRDQTNRVMIASTDVLAKRRDAIERFKRAYAKTIDWMYSDPRAIEYYAEGLNIPIELARKTVSEYYPKSALDLTTVKGLHVSMNQAVELKRLTAPLTETQIRELFPLVETPAQ